MSKLVIARYGQKKWIEQTTQSMADLLSFVFHSDANPCLQERNELVVTLVFHAKMSKAFWATNAQVCSSWISP